MTNYLNWLAKVIVDRHNAELPRCHRLPNDLLSDDARAMKTSIVLLLNELGKHGLSIDMAVYIIEWMHIEPAPFEDLPKLNSN